MLNFRQIQNLTQGQKDDIERLLADYETTKNGLRLLQYVRPLQIIIEQSCCGGMQIDAFAQWLRFLIYHNYNPPQ